MAAAVTTTVCPRLPVLHRSGLYKDHCTKISMIIKSINYENNATEEYSDEINKLLSPIPVSFVQTVTPQFRSLLSHLIFHAPLLDNSVMALITKHTHLCGVASAQGNYPLHELMLSDRYIGELNVDLVNTIIDQFPDALSLRNNAGDLPLHCLLGSHRGPTVELLKLLVSAAPATASMVNTNEKLPIHLLLRSHDTTCPECLQVLIKAYPQGVVSEAVDEIISLRIGINTTTGLLSAVPDVNTGLASNVTAITISGDSSTPTAAHTTGDSNSSGSGSNGAAGCNKRRVVWTPMSRVIENADYNLHEMMETALTRWGYARFIQCAATISI